MFEFFHRYLIQINNYQYLKIPLPVQQNLFQIQLMKEENLPSGYFGKLVI